MPVTFENDNDIIVYALECVIAHARRTQHIFVAQCLWWLASIIGLEKELVSRIDRLQKGQSAEPWDQLHREVSATPRDPGKDQRINKVLNDTKQYLKESKRLRKIVAFKASGQTTTGRIKPSRVSKEHLRKSKNTLGSSTKIEGINASEISRRKAAGECLRCAWPSDRKGSHRVKDCNRNIKVTIGTVEFPRTPKKLSTPLGSSDPEERSGSSDNIDYDLRPYAPIVLSEVLLDRCCYPRNISALQTVGHCSIRGMYNGLKVTTEHLRNSE